jgi:hypothetical protein
MGKISKNQNKGSKTKIIATGGQFQVEIINFVGEDDYDSLIRISKSLIEDYGQASKLTPSTINTYFNKIGSFPFIARHHNNIIGYIIGVPLEELKTEPWARLDVNFGLNNTIYTYAFVIEKKYKKNGYAKMLKQVFLNWIKKQKNILYITGHVREGVANNFRGKIKILDKINNWNKTGLIFEYYRRELDPDKVYTSKKN